MTSVDTNVVIRFLTRDDEQQYQRAYKVFAKEDVFVPDTVLLESEWVLRYAYSFTRKQIGDAFLKLLGLSNVRLANPTSAHDALRWYVEGLDFADALHLAGSRHCKRMVSFDKRVVSRSAGLSPCHVSLP